MPRKVLLRQIPLLIIVIFSYVLWSCARSAQPQAESAEQEAHSRTEFTDKLENFFEYEPLKAGKPSQFLIHLTDLSDGSPVEKADVTLSVHSKNSRADTAQVKARIGKVAGIYVAEVTVAQKGEYDIEFHIKNSKLDERMPLGDFKVE